MIRKCALILSIFTCICVILNYTNSSGDVSFAYEKNNSKKPVFAELTVNYCDDSGRSVKMRSVKKIRVSDADAAVFVKASTKASRNYKYTGSSYSHDKSPYSTKIDPDDSGFVSFRVDKDVKKINLNINYENYADVSVSSVSTKKAVAGEYAVSEVRIRNSSIIPVYSIFVTFEIAGEKYERQLDIQPKRVITVPFTWRVPSVKQSLNSNAYLTLSGYYEERSDRKNDNSKRSAVKVRGVKNTV